MGLAKLYVSPKKATIFGVSIWSHKSLYNAESISFTFSELYFTYDALKNGRHVFYKEKEAKGFHGVNSEPFHSTESQTELQINNQYLRHETILKQSAKVGFVFLKQNEE